MNNKKRDNIINEKLALLRKNEIRMNEKQSIYTFSESAFDICSVDIPKPILNNNSSYVQSLAFLYKQSAINSSSFVCSLSNSLAFWIKGLYFSNETNSIILNNSAANSLNSSSDNLVLFKISLLCLRNSSFSLSGANNDNRGLSIMSK